jgi:glycogen synthase
MQRLRILFVSAEATPFAHTGGLGEVVGTLPLKPAELGHDIRVVMPLYQTVRDRNVPLQRLSTGIEVPLVISTRTATVWQGALGASQANNGVDSSPARVPVYFIEQDDYFARPGLYGDQNGDYEDNALRFLFFSRAVLALPQATAWFPHIFHCHDWHTALVPAFLRHLSGLDKRLTEARRVGVWKEEEIGAEYLDALARLVGGDCIHRSGVKVAVDLLWGTAGGFLDRFLKKCGALATVFRRGRDPSRPSA